MTAIHPHNPPVSSAIPSLEGLVLAWDVLPDAPGVRDVLASTEAPEEARVCFRLGRHEVRVTLETTRRGGGAAERVTLSTFLAPIRIGMESVVGERRLVHCEVAGVLRMTLVLEGDGTPRVWFARSPILNAMGFPAGSYDRPDAAWDT